jgi:penicillin-binding protein 2
MLWRKRKKNEVSFDEILLDASNLPSFNQGRMEGRIELPITKRNVALVGFLFAFVACLFLYKLFMLQVVQGAYYKDISENNTVDTTTIIAERGVIYDRKGELIAWNEDDKSDKYSFPMRAYTNRKGLGQLTGYVSYPLKDKKGFYYRTEYLGRNGVEGAYDTELRGKNGEKIVETNAHGDIVGEHEIEPPVAGKAINLSIDAELSEAMYDVIATATAKAGFRSGAVAIMDIHTGEILGMTSFPSYDPEVMADGDDVALIESYNNDTRFPFLNKVLGGVYTPGSIVKPFMAYAALAEKIIDPNKVIVSNGSLMLPNPYDPLHPTKFVDWRAHGAMTMREAIAFSSNVYFYIIGGGFGDQKGLGITKIKEYMSLFGLGQKTGIALSGEQEGTVPDPAWKKEVFEDDWRLGDTYHTSIGQFGFQTTPLQMLRAYGALANGGQLFVPHVEKGVVGTSTDLHLDASYLKIVREGMRKTVNFPGGTARPLERSDVAIAAKSGTAELGANNAFVNSWAAGYFPYEDPQYAFILMMDKAPRSNALGATRVMGEVVEWMSKHTPEYLSLPPLKNASSTQQ